MEEIDLDDTKPAEIKKVDNIEDSKESFSFKGSNKGELISCLRNEKVKVTFVPKQGGLVTDPKHVLYGGLGVNSKRGFVVPRLESGTLVNPLTNSEKAFLEYVMGLPENALSVYLKVNNYWSNNRVYIGKEGIILDLSIPEEYIKYKILLCNKDTIASSEEELKKNKKATYQFVMIKEGQELENSINSLDTKTESYISFSEIKNDLDKLSLIIEIGTGKNVSSTNKKSIYTQINEFIENNPAKFLEIIRDEYLDTKLLIKKGVELGYIRKRGAYYYLTENNAPLCTNTQEPTLLSACQYLNTPKYQEVKFMLEANINK